MRKALFVICAGVLLGPYLQAQSSSCSIEQPPLRTSRQLIFNDQQEQWLGDAQARQQEPSYNLLPEKDSAELVRIGQKLLAQLPPTPTRFSFRVYESGEANGFSLAGGYVYVSRKLITDAHNEDEVAGVLAHEIGHIYTRQLAAAYTREFKVRLGVTSLGDRADVEDKMQLLNNVPWKDRAAESEDEAEKDELLADRVGMYALIKAGYAPRAMSENLDRITANKGHMGNFFTDILGGTSEISRRVRVTRKIASSLPEDCGKREPGSSPEFKAFQEAIRNARVQPLLPPTPGIASLALDPPIHPSLDFVRFSPDGKSILAQTGSRIHVLSRSPLKLLFSINAAGAAQAHFTPDSAHIVFHYPTLRVERWSVATGARESFHELVDYDGCTQSSLAPDGNLFVCITETQDKVWLKLVDVETGKRIYEDQAFYLSPTFWQSTIIVRKHGGIRVGSILYSQDGKTMLIVSGAKVFAYNLPARVSFSLSDSLAHLSDGRLAFVDSSRLLYECNGDIKAGTAADTFQLCLASFPEGHIENTFKIGYQWIEPVTRGANIVVGPFKESAAILTDPATGKGVAGFKQDSLDLYGNQVAAENDSGGITVSDLDGQHAESIALPVDRMNDLEAAQFSPDGRFLAYSSKARSAIWDLQAQKRVAQMRGFRAVRFDTANQMYAQYPQAGARPGQNFHIDLTTGKATPGPAYAIDQFQYGDLLLTPQPQDKTGITGSNIILQAVDDVSGAPLWSKRYPHDSPTARETEDGTLLLQFPINADSAQDELKHAGGKITKTSDWKNEWVSKGLLIELVDSHTGEIRHGFQAPESHGYWDGNDTRWSVLYGDYLVVHGIYNNSTIYRASDGARLGAFYGRVLAGNGQLGLLAVTNRDQEVTILDAKTGGVLKQVTVDEVPIRAGIIPARNALLVLTASQHVFTIDLPAAGISASPGHQ